jgi:hypothetical protein
MTKGPKTPKIYERRYHATWMLQKRSALSTLGSWMCEHRVDLAHAPLDLLAAAAADVADRLPRVAAREPTRRHRKHFMWLLSWQQQLGSALARGTS